MVGVTFEGQAWHMSCHLQFFQYLCSHKEKVKSTRKEQKSFTTQFQFKDVQFKANHRSQAYLWHLEKCDRSVTSRDSKRKKRDLEAKLCGLEKKSLQDLVQGSKKGLICAGGTRFYFFITQLKQISFGVFWGGHLTLKTPYSKRHLQ